LDDCTGKDNKSLLNRKLEPEYSLRPTTEAKKMRFLNERAQLDYTIFSQPKAEFANITNDMFIHEEINLAEQTMKHALTKKTQFREKNDSSTIIVQR